MTSKVAEPVFQLPAGEDFLLLSPTEQAFAYSNVDGMFATRQILRGDAVRPIPRGMEIAPRYRIGDADYGVDDFVRRARIAGVLIISDGRVVTERYSLGLRPDIHWSSMSMVKSLTAILVGAAVKDGALSLDQAVSRYLPALRGSAYDSVTVRHLITMSSGVQWNEDYTDRNSHVNRYSKSLGDKVPGGVLALMKTLQSAHAPGSTFNYNTGDTYVLGCLLTAATGMPLAQYMSEKIWSRVGMEHDAFYTLESEGGQEIGGSRAGCTLRDFGRFGSFVLDNGVIDGAAMLPPDWIESAGSPAFSFSADTNPYGATGYGYGWWIDPDGAMVALGFAGQIIYINRKRRLVIVRLSAQPQPPFDAAYAIDFKAEHRAFKDAVVQAIS